MSFNGSGVFSLIAGNPVVTGTVISSTWANNTLADIANGLTDCITRDGQSPPTVNIPMGNFRITGLGAGVALTDAATLGQVTSGATAQLGTVIGANTITAASVPAITSYALGQEFNFVAAGTNTLATVTLNINALGAIPITKYGTMALQPSDILSGQIVKVRFDGTNFEMINPGAVTTGLVGSSRNARMYVSAASSNATFTVDELVVENALGGLNYKLQGLNLNVNLTSTGAGGLDTGATVANGYVPIYVIYNPTTGTAALLGKNTSVLASEIYNGASMPAGYTHSALVAVVATNGASQIKPILITDRIVDFISVTVLITSSQTGAAITALSVSQAIPPNARRVKGSVTESSTTLSQVATNIYTDAASGGMGAQVVTGSSTGTSVGGNFIMDLVTAQFIYYTATSSSGTPTFVIALSGYEF